MEQTKFEEVFSEITELFKSKNTNGYGSKHIFQNFILAAERHFGSASKENIFKVAEIYKDKHMVTISQNSIHTSELEERLKDIIIYSILQILMLRDKDLP